LKCLLPPPLEESLPKRHATRFLAGVTSKLDISAMAPHSLRADAHLKATCHALMLLRLLVSDCATSIRS
jgi:hypothetical protein